MCGFGEISHYDLILLCTLHAFQKEEKAGGHMKGDFLSTYETSNATDHGVGHMQSSKRSSQQ